MQPLVLGWFLKFGWHLSLLLSFEDSQLKFTVPEGSHVQMRLLQTNGAKCKVDFSRSNLFAGFLA